MKKIAVFTLILILSCTSFVFADIQAREELYSEQYTDEQLINLAEDGVYINNGTVQVEKIDAEAVIHDAYNISLDDAEFYLITEKHNSYDLNTLVKSLGSVNSLDELFGARLDNYEARAAVYVKNIKDGDMDEQESSSRVYVTTAFGYTVLTLSDGSTWVTGRYYGGKIDSQPASSQITSIKGIYREGGASYVDINGKLSQGPAKKIETTFDVSKRTKLQTATVNTGRYWDSFGAMSTVGAGFEVKGTVNGNTFGFTATALRLGNW